MESRRRCIQNIRGVSIRDQSPASESKMKSCLVGVTASDWLTLLNGKIFFFLEEAKAMRLAETYSSYANTLLEVETAALLARYREQTTLCRINSGAFLYNPRPRGRDSFIPLATYIFRNKRDTPAELTVDCAIPDLVEMSTFREIEFPTNLRSGTLCMNPPSDAAIKPSRPPIL